MSVTKSREVRKPPNAFEGLYAVCLKCCIAIGLGV